MDHSNSVQRNRGFFGIGILTDQAFPQGNGLLKRSLGVLLAGFFFQFDGTLISDLPK